MRPVKHKFHIRFHCSDGYRKFQLKLGGDPDDDIARFKLIREALDKECVIVGDANTGTHPSILLPFFPFSLSPPLPFPLLPIPDEDIAIVG